MGFKADGTPVMMVVEKGGYGASYEECGEILKGLGCVDGFFNINWSCQKEYYVISTNTHWGCYLILWNFGNYVYGAFGIA